MKNICGLGEAGDGSSDPRSCHLSAGIGASSEPAWLALDLDKKGDMWLLLQGPHLGVCVGVWGALYHDGGKP